MKCDELKRFDIVGKYRDEETMYEFRPDGVCYDADEVDAAIVELKDDTLKQKRALWLARAERAKDRATTCNDFAYLGDAEREINMSLARTWMKCRMLKPSEWSKVWNNVERKCRAKAEEYK